MPRIILYAVAIADFTDEREIMGGAAAQPFCFDHLAVFFQFSHAFFQFKFDTFYRPFLLVRIRDEMLCGENENRFDIFLDELAGNGIDAGNIFYTHHLAYRCG